MRKDLELQIQAVKQAVRAKVSSVQGHPLGHAFLWGTVEVKLKSGKPKRYKCCLTSVCAEDLDAVCRLAETVPGVSDVYYNLD